MQRYIIPGKFNVISQEKWQDLTHDERKGYYFASKMQIINIK